MADVEQPATPTPPKKRRILRNLMLTLLIVIVFLVAALGVMFTTDKGSQFLLNRVMERQHILSYEYEGGNLLQGIILKNVWVKLKDLDVKIDKADISLGWRAILSKEIHLSRADVRNLQIISHAPPTNEPFKFSEIKLPFVLRLNQADVDHLRIQTVKSKVDFHDIYLEDAVWSGTELKFENSRMNMGYLALANATGQMTFSGKYPLNAHADLKIPSLKSLNIETIKVAARGSLDTVLAGVATNTPDLLTGWVVVHPVQNGVPMFGQLNFKNYHWPLLTEQKLFSKDGIAKFKGNVEKLDLDLATDLKGENIPEGQYSAVMSTDLVNGLDIRDFNGQLMQGFVTLAGYVGWHDHVTWDVKGRLNRLNPKDKVIPQAIVDFLPPSLDANVTSQGSLEKGMALTANLDFDKYESWAVKLNQAATPQSQKAQPMLLDISWKNIDRAVPYIGWLNSDDGQVNLALVDSKQDIHIATHVRPHEKTTLPAGKYTARLDLKDNILNVPDFSYQALQKGSLTGQAKVELPSEKRQLKWNAILNAKDFNPQSITPAAPVNLLNGQIKANGYAKPNQQIIQFDAISLKGRMANSTQNEMVELTGKSTAAIVFNDEKSGGGFKGFAVRYDGGLNAFNQGKGLLKFNVSGTPDFIKIAELQHNGVAGKIYASGAVNLKNAIGWDINASLVRFKPQYFVSTVKGELSGNLKTQGLWAEHSKRINIEKLNMAGFLNNKVVRGMGNLSIVLNNNQKGFLPQQFEANNLFLAYGQNQIQASGNAQNLRLKINAPAMYEIYPGLRGRTYGYLNVQAQPRLKATANLAVDNFGFGDMSVKKIQIRGELPTSDTTPTSLKATLDDLRRGGRQIQYAGITLSGTRKAHLVQLQGWNYYSKFYVQLAGGFNQKNDWLGQIQQGIFDSRRAVLKQQQNAAVIYTQASQELFVGQHCWTSQNSQLCIDQPLRVSKTRGNVSIATRDLDLNDFAAFMPEGLAITGKLNGYAKASWANGSQPKLDAQLITQNGEIGLAAADPQDPASTLNYDQLSVIAKSVSQGLLLRLDVKTPEIGTGYAKVIINPYQTPMPMNGEVAFNNVQLKVLKPFISDVRSMNGTLALAGKVNGTLTQPQITGELRLKDGAISMMSLPINLTNIQLYSSIRQDNASINGAFNSGRGVGQLTGNFDWKNDPRLQLNLKGDNLLVRQAPLITAIVTPDISMEAYPLTKRLVVNGKIDVPRALISMPESTEPVVAVSSDVRIVRDGQDQLAILKAAKPWDIRADVSVNIGSERVIFQGFNSRIPLVGRLNLSQRGLETAMRASGAIGVSQKVKIEAYGQSLDLNRAIARFNGPLSNPTLDVDATKSVQGSTVGVRVTGTASVPNIQIYNDAGLSEQEALNALVTGRINEGNSGLSNTAGFKSDVNNTIAAAGISMGLGGTRALTNQIGRTFGLSGLALDAQGTGDDTQVSLTGYITPDLFIRYGVGVFTPVNKLTLRYQMNKRMYLEASQSLERAVDVFYNWRF
ncbi:translocation/assembly module TamB domain-containing protein [Acinetobacter ihumii]|uniref:translocation/assembly module TamB domain-containing protein n=1 Tax=Acinetobacter ihumii TaxID=2483802 RepID=UPI00102F82AE|nr:translocation/assembly module TamB domain-containing protein [Acinetobacter ihumii]